MKKPETIISLPVNVYYVNVRCNNCDLKQEIYISNGSKIFDTNCPKCKCKSLRLDEKQTKYNQH